MDWELEVKRLISEALDAVCGAGSGAGSGYVSTKIVDNKLIITATNIRENITENGRIISIANIRESKDFEVIIEELDVNQQTPGITDPE